VEAQKVTREYGQAKGDLDVLDRLGTAVWDLSILYELGVDEDDDSVEAELLGGLAAIGEELERLELRSLFTGEHDESDAVCEIHAKDGGTDAQDWAQMLVRMYNRWAERRGFDFEIEEVSEGQEAGILSASFIVRGRFANGLLASERGMHRLVRISPFDSQARRQTSFAAVSVVPFFEDLSGEVDIDEKDLRIDTYRSSGAGGQHVNVTDSAVRITHLPTGTVVAVQNERSQFQNKAKAMQILASKLADLARQARVAEMSELAGPKALVGWGAQIRSYVLAPYQQVKDLRSGYESGNVSAVLDGDLDSFMEAYLRWRRAGLSAPEQD
jgi:peptide chain release factor 2